MIYVDVSQLSQWMARGRHLTGIQRLTFNCVAGIYAAAGSDQLRVIVYDESAHQFKSACAEAILGLSGKLDSRTWELAVPEFASGDQILLTEWIFSSRISNALFELAGRVEANIYQFVHDCVPLARPDFLRKYLVEDFQKKMGQAILQADVVLTNSDYSRQDIEKFFPVELGNKEIRVVKLAHEFGANEIHGQMKPTPTDTVKSERLLRRLSSQPFVLMVGTLEERKNTQLAIRQWRDLSKRHGSNTPKLVLVGSYGWHKIGLLASLMSARFFWRSVIHLRNCDDTTLMELYKKSLFTIYLSSYEGWGLPVGESMWLGKPVLCSKLTSLPEVGEDLVDYVDPGDADAVAKAVERLCFDSEYRSKAAAKLKSAKLRSARDFAKNLLAAIGVVERKKMAALR